MNVYILRIKELYQKNAYGDTTYIGFGEYIGFVVAAKTEQSARNRVAQFSKGNSYKWLDEDESFCEKIGVSEKSIKAGILFKEWGGD